MGSAKVVVHGVHARTVEGNEKADGTLRHPLADAIAGTRLDASNQRRIVDYTVEDLACCRRCRGRLAGTAAGIVRPRAGREVVAGHGPGCHEVVSVK
jgi:hypothetical protein